MKPQGITAAIEELQAQTVTATADAEAKRAALQTEHDAYVVTSDATLAELQEKYDADMVVVEEVIYNLQMEAMQTQADLMDKLTIEEAELVQPPAADANAV